jgi:exodeoxyribonuclease VII large subunit
MSRGGSPSDAEPPLPGSRLAPLSVTQLNELADAQLREGIGPLWIAGEIVRFVAHASGHWYFTLTDGRASVSCAMFRRENLRVRFAPADGLEVLALALPSIYAVQGRFQLAVSALEPLGAGSAALAFEQLKAKLAAEGLFDPDRKRPLPLFPRRIGIVTSADGAALRDALRVLARRVSGLTVLVIPATVQGAKAPEELVAALAAADARGLDLLLLVRGGGAREDLAAFDDERVVRAVVACRTPVVTGVGHEIDTTLVDYAADLRAPTPSAAAELVVRAEAELAARVAAGAARLAQAARRRIDRARAQLVPLSGSRALGSVPLALSRLAAHVADLGHRLELAQRAALGRRRRMLATWTARLSPEGQRARLAARRHRLHAAQAALRAAAARRAALARSRCAALGGRLEALSPLAVLARGYALVTREGRPAAVVRDAATLALGEPVTVRLARGAFAAKVELVLDDPPSGGGK